MSPERGFYLTQTESKGIVLSTFSLHSTQPGSHSREQPSRSKTGKLCSSSCLEGQTKSVLLQHVFSHALWSVCDIHCCVWFYSSIVSHKCVLRALQSCPVQHLHLHQALLETSEGRIGPETTVPNRHWLDTQLLLLGVPTLPCQKWPLKPSAVNKGKPFLIEHSFEHFIFS